MTFEVDPSISKIENEHVKLAQYMKDRYLSLDIYDSDSRFNFGVCKIPLYELMRQQNTKGYVLVTKECEVYATGTAGSRGIITLLMRNKGLIDANE